MVQQSVYSKLALNRSITKLVNNKINKNIPDEGLVQVLTITEKQYARIETLVGEKNKSILDSTDRTVIV